MSLNNIYIMTDAIHSGKTTTLQQWLRNKEKSTAGILTPDKDGKRKLYDISQNMYYDFEMGEEHPVGDTLMIGKYRFSRSGFAHAQEILLRSVKEDPDWLIVDEVGRLELDSKTGLEPSLTEIVNIYKSGKPTGRLILVIRNYLVDEAVNMWGLNTDMIIHKAFFE